MTTEQERAAALADKIELRGCVDLTSKWDWGQDNADSIALIVSALRAYARPAPANLREAIIAAIEATVRTAERDVGASSAQIADAILSLLPQTQDMDDAASFDARVNAAESILRAGEV